MRFYFLGTGAAFTVAEDNFQSNAILQDDGGRCLLIDCGTDVRRALRAAGLSRHDLAGAYVSHLHGDHIGGLEWLGFSTYFDPDAGRLPLFVPEPLVTPLWHDTLKGGMGALDHGPARLEDYFDVRPVPSGRHFVFGGTRIDLVPVDHIRCGLSTMASYGLMIEAPAGPVLFTSDCLFQPDTLMPYYDRARLIFHDCDTGPTPGGVHAHFQQLSTLPEAVRAKMWLYHHADGPLPDACAAGFAGFARPHQVFEFGTGTAPTESVLSP